MNMNGILIGSDDAPAMRGGYSYVQTITFHLTPDDHDLIVYVGFDEGKKG